MLDALCQRVMVISLFHSFGPKCMGHNWGFLLAFISPWRCSNKTANPVIVFVEAIEEAFRRTVGERKMKGSKANLSTLAEKCKVRSRTSLYCFYIDFESYRVDFFSAPSADYNRFELERVSKHHQT